MVKDATDVNSIVSSLRTFISGTILHLARVASFENDDSFLEKGILDSTGVLELVSYIEKQFAIRVEADEIIPDNLDSVNKLTTFIQKKITNVVS